MSVVLACVGDVVVTRPLPESLNKPGTRAAIERLARADCVIGNLEIPLCDRGAAVSKLVTHRASPERAPELAAMGFDVLVLANNHATDYGLTGLLDTMDHLTAAGIVPLGVGRSLAEARSPHVIRSADLSVAVMAVSALLPLGAEAGPDRPGMAPLRVYTSYEADPNILMEQPGSAPRIRTRVDDGDRAALLELVRHLKSEHDYVVCYVHWGVGLQQERAEYQTTLGPVLVEAGVDLVVGCHPHTIQEIEAHGGGYVFYNLGEFFSQYAEGTIPPDLPQIQPEGYILEVEFDGRGARVRLVPVALDDQGDPSLQGTERVIAKIRRMCRVPCEVGSDGVIELPPLGRARGGRGL